MLRLGRVLEAFSEPSRCLSRSGRLGDDDQLEFFSGLDHADLGLEHRAVALDVGELGDLTLRADWNHRGRVYNSRNNLPAYEQGKRGVLSARITLRLVDDKTDIALWGRNLLDREYLLAGAPDFDGAFGSEAIQFAAPRRFGIELTRHFGD